MSYNIVLGDLGPDFPLTCMLNGKPFELQVTDTVTLRYKTPAGTLKNVGLTITDAPSGQVKRTWLAGDLPEVGTYRGQVKVERVGDATFPRTFPNDGGWITWPVNESL
jgi:hypothetical protein